MYFLNSFLILVSAFVLSVISCVKAVSFAFKAICPLKAVSAFALLVISVASPSSTVSILADKLSGLTPVSDHIFVVLLYDQIVPVLTRITSYISNSSGLASSNSASFS